MEETINSLKNISEKNAGHPGSLEIQKNEGSFYAKLNSIAEKMKAKGLKEDAETLQFIQKAIAELLQNFKNLEGWDQAKLEALEERSRNFGIGAPYMLIPIRHKQVSEEIVTEPRQQLSLQNIKALKAFLAGTFLGEKKAGTLTNEQERDGSFIGWNVINLPKKYPSISKEGLEVINEEFNPHSPVPVQSYFNSSGETDTSVHATISPTNLSGIDILHKLANTDLKSGAAEKARDFTKRLKSEDPTQLSSEMEYYALTLSKEFFKSEKTKNLE